MSGVFESVAQLVEGEACLCGTAQGQIIRTAFRVGRRQVILCEECERQLRDGIAYLRQGRERRDLLEAHAQALAASHAETTEARTELDRVRAQAAQMRDTVTNAQAAWDANLASIRELQKKNRELTKQLAELESPTAA